jgi:hypothetical protein
MFNALKYIKSLEAVGFHREQAEAQVQLVIAAIEDEVATKSELNEFRNEVKAEFAHLRAEISDLKSDLVFKLGALFVGFNTLGFGLVGILIAFMTHR